MGGLVGLTRIRNLLPPPWEDSHDKWSCGETARTNPLECEIGRAALRTGSKLAPCWCPHLLQKDPAFSFSLWCSACIAPLNWRAFIMACGKLMRRTLKPRGVCYSLICGLLWDWREWRTQHDRCKHSFLRPRFLIPRHFPLFKINGGVTALKKRHILNLQSQVTLVVWF